VCVYLYHVPWLTRVSQLRRVRASSIPVSNGLWITWFLLQSSKFYSRETKHEISAKRKTQVRSLPSGLLFRRMEVLGMLSPEPFSAVFPCIIVEDSSSSSSNVFIPHLALLMRHLILLGPPSSLTRGTSFGDDPLSANWKGMSQSQFTTMTSVHWRLTVEKIEINSE